MSQREKLVEELEEALFAVVVNDYMEAEGARLLELNQRLKEAPEASGSKGADERCFRLIDQACRRSRYKRYGRSAYRLVTKAALIACCLMVLFTTAFAVSPTLQEKTVNLIIQTFDISTKFEFHESDGLTGNPRAGQICVGNYGFSEIPEGYSSVDSGSDGMLVWILYANSNGDTIYIETVIGEGQFSADTEGAKLKESVVINEYKGIYVEKDDVRTYYLGDTVNVGYVTIQGIGVDREILECIAYGISYQGE